MVLSLPHVKNLSSSSSSIACKIQLLCPVKVISFSIKLISIICFVDKLNIDKSINEKLLFHLGISKNPNFEKTNNFVGQASFVI